MSNTVERKVNKPAGESAEFYVASWAFAKGNEKGNYETVKSVSDEEARNAVVEVNPFSDKLEKGMTIKAESNPKRETKGQDRE